MMVYSRLRIEVESGSFSELFEGSSDEEDGDDDEDEGDESKCFSVLLEGYRRLHGSVSEAAPAQQTTIMDNTETNLVAFRRTVYLTIQSSLDFQEAIHKLLKMEIKPGMEVSA